ncbi:gliding motility lipoprotein GldB [Pedobacter rhizosphaerae]|uniref:Gliding motility-associated lipoprotein GldB n=1 Tax=Pedobacter rhizosphaerae TaxID=390241 RepID=A0A1H9V8K3_9SPHI|nr:gliding motility lipoprotein GldB [Pedobacter rhizosphaerae]SES18022.1 gliding motility-associated lipoprotein GldB [Pedobacter rhizosphaerae]
MMYNVKQRQIYLIFLFAIAFISCKQSKRPDVSNINVDIKIERFDQELAKARQNDLAQVDLNLNQKYGLFYDDYIHKMIGSPNYSNQQVLEILFKDKAYADLTHDVDSVYPNLKTQEAGLTETFKYIKYYYPKARIPRMISFVSGFAYQMPVGDQYLGIGLDMFLGKDSKFYKAIIQSVPLYLSRRFTPEYIVPRVTETYAHEELFPEPDENKSLLAKMVFQGKILYFLDQVLPEHTPDSIKIGYTSDQLQWAQNFEGNIWAYFLENNFLYETDYQKIQVFLSEGPFTPGLGENRESAPKLGVWTGWQMVKKYMAEHPEVTLQQLMADHDAQKILNQSRYKPKPK